MKHVKSYTALIAVTLCICLACLFFTACGETPVEPVTVTLSETNITTYVGDPLRLTAETSRDLLEDEKLEWSSDNEEVATVRGGTVTTKATGTVKITAAVGEAKAECTVTVSERTITITPADGLALDILDPEKNTLTLTAAASDGSKVSWSSENSSIADVDQNGLVTARGSGSVKIFARVNATSASVTVTVTPDDYYVMTTLNNAGVAGDPGVWHWFTQSANNTYTLASQPIHANGKATLAFTAMQFTGDEGVAEGTKLEYYFRYQPDNIEQNADAETDGYAQYTFKCKISTTIAGDVLIGVDNETAFNAQTFTLAEGENDIEIVLPLFTNPINIKILIHGATEENPLVMSVYDYSFTPLA